MNNTACMAIMLAIGAVLAGCHAPIIDSRLTRAESLAGTQAPDQVKDQMVMLDVRYYSFDNQLHQGQIVVDCDAQDDVQRIFRVMLHERFLIDKCIPLVHYAWSDDASMADNNTSGFNYRTIAGTNCLSNHSFGRAIDINPVQNPAIYANGSRAPQGAQYDPQAKGTLAAQGAIVKEFTHLGWRWGGDYKSFKDYQHFEKMAGSLQNARSTP
ncbi:MAG: M15 family metallopeptidase [bacterium]|nr:M15 family metallopeptidase [bacterium]